MRLRLVLILTCLCCPWTASAAQPLAQKAPGEDPAHEELRAVRDGILTAMKKKDLAALQSFVHPNVVVTWQDAEVSRGRPAFAAYYKRMMEGSESIVESLDMNTTVDELSILYGGDTAISFGGSKDHFKLRGGLNFDMDSRWSATLVKEGGHWLVASLHASSNLFDNALLRAAKGTLYWAVPLAAVGGILIGVFVGRSLARKSA